MQRTVATLSMKHATKTKLKCASLDCMKALILHRYLFYFIYSNLGIYHIFCMSNSVLLLDRSTALNKALSNKYLIYLMYCTIVSNINILNSTNISLNLIMEIK